MKIIAYENKRKGSRPTMKWIIELTDGRVMSEDDLNFAMINQFDNVRRFYFNDGQSLYGVNVINGRFFIDDNEFDFKVKKRPERLIQYKSASIALTTDKRIENKIKSWNIGYEVYINQTIERYIMSINETKRVYLIASKYDLTLNRKIDEKRIHLK